MTKKLDNLSSDIVKLLKNMEPKRLRWSEIVHELYPSFKFHFKTERIFGSAVSERLKDLIADHLIVHEGMYYGSLNSKSPEREPFANIRNEVRKVYDEVLLLRLHPPERVREDGTAYSSQSEFYKALGVLVNMHPRLREAFDSVLRQSQLKNDRSVKWVGDMTTMEIDTLLGQLGQVLDELKPDLQS